EAQSNREPQQVEPPEIRGRNRGPEDDGGVRPEEDGDQTELEEPAFRGPRPVPSSSEEAHDFDDFDSNIRPFGHGLLDASPNGTQYSLSPRLQVHFEDFLEIWQRIGPHSGETSR